MIGAQNSYPLFDSIISGTREYFFSTLDGNSHPFLLRDEMIRAVDEIYELRAKVWEFERPERERAERTAWWKSLTDNACQNLDSHAMTRRVNGREICSNCGKDVTEQHRHWID